MRLSEKIIMGMNYYWNPELIVQIYGVDIVDQDDPKIHIGKMSSAGKYCRSCGITQYGHTVYVHLHTSSDPAEQCLIDISRLDEQTCPNCKQPWGDASSFIFTMMGHLVTISNFYNIEITNRNIDPTRAPLKVIMDGYGRPYTAVEFLDTIIRTCPIQFQHYGVWS